MCIGHLGPPLCLIYCLRRITLCGRTVFDLLSESAEEDYLTLLGKVEFDATQGSKGEGVEIRVGKDKDSSLARSEGSEARRRNNRGTQGEEGAEKASVSRSLNLIGGEKGQRRLCDI